MASRSCPVCLATAEEPVHLCPGCSAAYHEACWPHGGCVVPGCRVVRKPAAPPASDRSAGWTAAFRGFWVVLASGLGCVLLNRTGPINSAPATLFGISGAFTFISLMWATASDLHRGAARESRLGTLAVALGTWGSVFVIFGTGGSFHAGPEKNLIALYMCMSGLAGIGLLIDAQKARAAVSLLVGLGLWATIPTPTGGRQRANTRACYANQKSIVGAIEMYNLDKNTKRTALDGSFFMDLKSGGYMQSIPQDPGFGPGSSMNYATTRSGNGITCSKHGTIQ